MPRFLALLAVAWLLLLPPLFTQGGCTAEFEAASLLVESNKPVLASSARASHFLRQQALPFTLVTAESCRKVKPRFLDRCGSGPLIQVEIPVSNRICRFYRDDATRVQLFYDERDRLGRIAIEMKPYRSLPLPGGGFIHWAR